MSERDYSKRNEQRQQQGGYQGGREAWRGSERGMGARSGPESHGARRWGAGEDWDEESYGRTQGRYAGDYESPAAERTSAYGDRLGRSHAQEGGLGRGEPQWQQPGRSESQRWGEQGTYGAQGSDYERQGSGYGRDREYGSRYASPYDLHEREQSGAYAQGYGAPGRGYGQGSEEYSNLRGYGTQAHGQGEHSSGSHGYGSGREYRGYEGGEAGRRAGMRHWERGFGEGYGLSSGYADEQAYASGYGAGEYGDRMPREYGRSYRGMGPRSYTRSDERLLEDVNERLTEDDYLDATEINVRCVNGVITLEGTVAERWMKHRAEDLADASSGVKQVDNRIQVRSQSERMGSATGETASSTQSRSRQGTTGTPGSSARGGDNPNASSQH
ncbi:MAG TPA: BON domain-containing protein [Lysobacter sp.]